MQGSFSSSSSSSENFSLPHEKSTFRLLQPCSTPFTFFGSTSLSSSSSLQHGLRLHPQELSHCQVSFLLTKYLSTFSLSTNSLPSITYPFCKVLTAVMLYGFPKVRVPPCPSPLPRQVIFPSSKSSKPVPLCLDLTSQFVKQLPTSGQTIAEFLQLSKPSVLQTLSSFSTYSPPKTTIV